MASQLSDSNEHSDIFAFCSLAVKALVRIHSINMQTGRRTFLKVLGSAPAATAQVTAPVAPPKVKWPRKFSGAQLSQIAFPLGGVAAGSISLGGRGQLRDWEIFNSPNKGGAPDYVLPSIWVKPEGKKAHARVAEGQFLPPYQGQTGLGSNNVPGMPRFEKVTFTGEYPKAHLEFSDRHFPAKFSLDAFTPIIPLDDEASGYPATTLRYRVTNPLTVPMEAAICYSIENPAGDDDARLNELKQAPGLHGVIMSNPGLPEHDPKRGTFVLAVAGEGDITVWRGWPKAGWWNSPMLFWDQFGQQGTLGAEPAEMNKVAAVCLKQKIAPGASADFTFILAWHYPNRTPEACGWSSPNDTKKTIVGNYHCTRFADAWAVAEDYSKNLPKLEARTDSFVAAMRNSTLPDAVKDAALSNLSTLATQTCFRTADGEFYGFEGSNDKNGCCHGSCTHVWNYETTTAHVFPKLSRSLRKGTFFVTMDDRGGLRFRESLPPGGPLFGTAAADGQMGQIMKVWLDWVLTGDMDWLREYYPKAVRALQFAWIQGGWDANRDGVLEGVQHNTYDVEFYGPNPQCGVYYLGALRAVEAMALVLNDTQQAQQCRELLDRGRAWIDANLFNGQFYIQKVQGIPQSQIAPALAADMGSKNTMQPDFQIGKGCLVDQLIGQYQAEVGGLGPLLDPAHIQTTLHSIYRYNYKRDMGEHQNFQRTFVLNDEAALVVCDYGEAARPKSPFPYYAEVFTGFEYAVAAHMMYGGMVKEGVECVESIRQRYDGERRNPWDEAECGHHYARAMAAWSPILALSGFRYHGGDKRVELKPRTLPRSTFQCFWSTGTGWGTFTLSPTGASLHVEEGTLPAQTVLIAPRGAARWQKLTLNQTPVRHQAATEDREWKFTLDEVTTLKAGDVLSFS